MTTLVVANPVVPGTAAAVEALLARGARLGTGQVEVVWTTAQSTGFDQASNGIRQGYDVMVAVGGDGTVRQVARAVRGTQAELAILPVGRANIAARNLGVPRRRRAQLDIALTGRSRPCDLAIAHLVTSGGEVRHEVFLAMAGMGHDARAIAAMPRTGHWARYFLAGGSRLRAEPFGVVVGGQPRRVWSVFVGNLPRVPGNIELFPGAHADSGTLVVGVVSPSRLLDWPGIAFDRLTRRPSNRTYRYRSVEGIRVVPDAPMPVHLDGDVVMDVREMEAAVAPGALRIRCLPRG